MNSLYLKGHIILCFFLMLIPLNVQGQTEEISSLPKLEDILPSPSLLEELLREGELLHFHSENISPYLIPETSLTGTIVRQIVRADFNLGIEGIFFTPNKQLPPSYSLELSEERTVVLYNILRSVSTLTGLEYYSASRKTMRLLFEESWVIPNPKQYLEALPDPLVTDIPPEDSFFIHQKDKSFSRNQSKITFLARHDAFATSIINISPLRYKGFLKVVNPGNMQTHLIVVPVQEGLLVYGAMVAKTLRIKSFLNRAEASFTNRVIALAQWYRERLGEEF